MKKNAFLLITLVILLFSCYEDADKEINIISQIDEIVNTNNMNVYISKEVLKPSTKIETFIETFVSPDYESKLVFIDEYPSANWTHPCKYLFMNPVTGEYTLLDKSSPPNIIDNLKSADNVLDLFF